MCVRAVRATYLIVHTTKKVRPFLLHIHITTKIKEYQRGIYRERSIRVECDWKNLRECYSPTLLGPTLFSSTYRVLKEWPFWFPL